MEIFLFFQCFLFELQNKADMQIRVILLKRIKMQIKHLISYMSDSL